MGCGLHTLVIPNNFEGISKESADAGALPGTAVEDLPGSIQGDVSIDFDTSGDFPIIYENTVRKDAQVRLAMQNTSSYHEEGYVDVELPHGDVLYGKMIYLQADRISSLHNGDFEESTDITSCDDTDTGLANTEDIICPGAELGRWFAVTSPNKAKVTKFK